MLCYEISDFINKWFRLTLIFICKFILHSIYNYVLSLSFYVCYETMENKLPKTDDSKPRNMSLNFILVADLNTLASSNLTSFTTSSLLCKVQAMMKKPSIL